jgi:hypothetical protein
MALPDYDFRLWVRTTVQIGTRLLAHVPPDGSAVGNTALMRALGWSERRYWYTRDSLLEEGTITRARGRGGAVRRVLPEEGSGVDASDLFWRGTTWTASARSALRPAKEARNLASFAILSAVGAIRGCRRIGLTSGNTDQ